MTEQQTQEMLDMISSINETITSMMTAASNSNLEITEDERKALERMSYEASIKQIKAQDLQAQVSLLEAQARLSSIQNSISNQ